MSLEAVGAMLLSVTKTYWGFDWVRE